MKLIISSPKREDVVFDNYDPTKTFSFPAPGPGWFIIEIWGDDGNHLYSSDPIECAPSDTVNVPTYRRSPMSEEEREKLCSDLRAIGPLIGEGTVWDVADRAANEIERLTAKFNALERDLERTHKRVNNLERDLKWIHERVNNLERRSAW